MPRLIHHWICNLVYPSRGGLEEWFLYISKSPGLKWWLVTAESSELISFIFKNESNSLASISDGRLNSWSILSPDFFP